MPIPEKQPFEISVRGYTTKSNVAAKPIRYFSSDPGPSQWALIFDTETTVDERQALRFGFYQLRNGTELAESGAIYNASELNAEEVGRLRAYSRKRNLVLISYQEFGEKYLVDLAYKLNAAIVGFNLPFDVSRLAIDHGNAQPSKGNFSMVGGFSFAFSWNREKPRIQIKHLNSRTSLIRFTVPMQPQDTARSRRKKKIFTPKSRGYFVDLKSLSAALLSGSHSLKSLAQILGTENQKHETDEHGLMTSEYLDYACQDVQVTWECFLKLQERFQELNLRTPINRILSEASLGKAYLNQMGIKPWRELQPDFPPERIGEIMSSFYGGRAEVKARRISVPVAYCDFLSMYPTVCTLMGLWKFVTSNGITETNVTEWAREFLSTVQLDDLKNPEVWKSLNCLVKVMPDKDVFPVRAKYDGISRSIGLNYLSSDKPMWFTLADCLASKIISGNSPHLIEAIRFDPVGMQPGLEPVNIAGNSEYRVDPNSDDFIKRCIELRTQVKAKMNGASGLEKDCLESEQLALKICANATSYGIYVELNSNSHGTPVEQNCYGYRGTPFKIKTKSVEEPGKYFHPLLGTLITGAARLMLACSEVVAKENGLSWAFCDTDGIAFIPIDQSTPKEELNQKVSEIRSWFDGLNPYGFEDQILKLESENISLTEGKSEPLYCFAISAKRYALYNISDKGQPILRKATAHGLGHLSEPYSETDAPPQIPSPQIDCRKIGVRRWQHDLWFRIIEAGQSEYPQIVRLDDIEGFGRRSASRYSATSPEILAWFRHVNSNREYGMQIRPFGFLFSFQADKEFGNSTPRGASPFHLDVSQAAEACFDRVKGNPINPDKLLSIRKALAQFHLHPESKFIGGDYSDSGITERRHVWVTSVEHIGKEANKWEEQMQIGEALGNQQVYGSAPNDESERMEALIAECRKVSRRRLAKESGVSLRQVTRILNRQSTPTPKTMSKLELGFMVLHRPSEFCPTQQSLDP